MKSVQWITSPIQSKEYYVKKLAEVRAREKNRSGISSEIDVRNLKEVEKELNKLISGV